MATKQNKNYVNPFYVMLVLAGVAFCINACAYGVMTVRAMRPEVAGDVDAIHPLVRWLDVHGFSAMLIELLILAICTVAAIATDEFWARRKRHEVGSPKQTPSIETLHSHTSRSQGESTDEGQ